LGGGENLFWLVVLSPWFVSVLGMIWNQLIGNCNLKWFNDLRFWFKITCLTVICDFKSNFGWFWFDFVSFCTKITLTSKYAIFCSRWCNNICLFIKWFVIKNCSTITLTTSCHQEQQQGKWKVLIVNKVCCRHKVDPKKLTHNNKIALNFQNGCW